MGITSFVFVIVLLQVFSALLCVHSEELESSSIIRCNKHELDALFKFKESFTRDPKKRLSSWVGKDCCEWHGVTCDNVTHNVVKLTLRNQLPLVYDDAVWYNFQYCLSDPQVSMVSYGVSSALLELKLLTHLDLSGNDFSRSRIPAFIGSMRQLRYLNLSFAGFSGPLPSQLGKLTNLVHLDLHDRRCYKQNLYSESLGWMSGLLKLRSLDMSNHNLSRAHDTFKALMTLPSLSALRLSNCLLYNSHLSEAVIISNTSNTYFPTLKHLDLQWNGFEGPLPPILKKMVSLRFLTLGFNHFNGSVMLWLNAMKRLETLDLRSNGFSSVEGGLMPSIEYHCNFKKLDLSNNSITQGDILEFVTSLSSGLGAFELEYLTLHNNTMNGSLPSLLGQFTKLHYLDLGGNKFKGGVPTSFVKLSALKYLDLSYNNLSETVPDFLGNLTRIEHLDISSNNLQGTLFGLGNLSKLSYLDMTFNKILKLDSSFNWRPSFQLIVFNAQFCGINTVFPRWLKNQTKIQYLDLSYTGISGKLPAWLWNSSALEELRLAGNRITGSLPQNGNNLWWLDLHSNLWWLDLHSNLLSGTIPKWLGQHAQVIDLSSNRLSGSIFDGNNASSLSNIGKFLTVLDLSDNMLSGEIQFGKVHPDTELEILSLRENYFNGPIRSELCNFRSLMVLELAHNRFTGQIPRCLGSIRFYNSYEPIRDASLQIKEIIKGIVEVTSGRQSIIDLSSNFLIGTIPEELVNISALFALNLSYNNLRGHIPQKIGSLKAVESLDLSNNQLSGTIPESLSFISWLSKLNLSNNNLHGPIPTGRQLQTLDDPSIYAGNSGLCGFPLPNDCTNVGMPPSLTNVNPTARKDGVQKKDKYEKMWFILTVMSGVATGFWGVVGTLVIKKSWRETYFRYVEDIADKIYVPLKVKVNRFKRRFNEKF